MKSIDKLRSVWADVPNKTLCWNCYQQIKNNIDEIEAEIERDYMPKPKIEKCFNAINHGVTDISEALQNIAECNAAKCAMRQEVTHADVETMIGSIAAIADAYYMRLPRDANNEPIYVGDEIQYVNEHGGTGAKVKVCAIADGYAFYDNGKHIHAYSSDSTRHVKPRTLDNIVADAIQYGHNGITGDRIEGKVAEFCAEIRELLGGDA